MEHKPRPLRTRFWTPGTVILFLFNESFPRHTGGAMVADGIGYYDRYATEHPEEILAHPDWMGIPIQGQAVSLARFKSLLVDQLNRL